MFKFKKIVSSFCASLFALGESGNIGKAKFNDAEKMVINAMKNRDGSFLEVYAKMLEALESGLDGNKKFKLDAFENDPDIYVKSRKTLLNCYRKYNMSKSSVDNDSLYQRLNKKYDKVHDKVRDELEKVLGAGYLMNNIVNLRHFMIGLDSLLSMLSEDLRNDAAMHRLALSHAKTASSVVILLAAIATAITGVALGGKAISDKMTENARIRRKMANQVDFDNMMKKTTGNSSINVNIPRSELKRRFKKLEQRSPQNAGVIRSIGRQIMDFLEVGKGSLVLFFEGNPACGKTSTALEIGRLLGATNPVIIGKNDIDENSKNLSIMQQMCGKWRVGDGENGYWQYGKFVSTLSHNEHPFAIIDEADKFPLDVFSAIWQLPDYSRLNSAGGDVIVKQGIFILTGNSSIAENVKANFSMTRESIESRTKYGTFHFGDANIETCVQAVESIFSMSATRARKKYGVEIIWDSDSVRRLASSYYRNGREMRWVKPCERKIAGIIADACESVKEKGKIFRLLFSNVEQRIKIVEAPSIDKIADRMSKNNSKNNKTAVTSKSAKTVRNTSINKSMNRIYKNNKTAVTNKSAKIVGNTSINKSMNRISKKN